MDYYVKNMLEVQQSKVREEYTLARQRTIEIP
jgi:hypothetical protein